MQKTIWFSCVHIQKFLNGSLSRVHNTPLKIKRSNIDSRPPKNPINISIRDQKEVEQKRGKEKKKKEKKNESNINKKYNGRGLRAKTKVLLSFVSCEAKFSK
jgi:hypothetical protein